MREAALIFCTYSGENAVSYSVLFEGNHDHFSSWKLRLGELTVFPPGSSEYLPGLGPATSSSDFQTCDFFFFPLCRFRKGKTEVSLNWAFVQWMKWLLEHRPVTRHSVNVWGMFTRPGRTFLSHDSQQPVWAFLARPGLSWTERVLQRPATAPSRPTQTLLSSLLLREQAKEGKEGRPEGRKEGREGGRGGEGGMGRRRGERGRNEAGVTSVSRSR